MTYKTYGILKSTVAANAGCLPYNQRRGGVDEGDACDKRDGPLHLGGGGVKGNFFFFFLDGLVLIYVLGRGGVWRDQIDR